MNTNPLSTVWESYLASQGCFEIATKVNQHDDRNNLLANSDYFSSLTQIDAESAIEQGKNVSNEMFVVLLWSTFEQFVRRYIQKRAQDKLYDISPASLASSVFVSFEKEKEFWNAADILELFQNILVPKGNSNLMEKAKQILQYSTWIVHAKNFPFAMTNQNSPKVTPLFAYETLNEMIDLMLQN